MAQDVNQNLNVNVTSTGTPTTLKNLNNIYKATQQVTNEAAAASEKVRVAAEGAGRSTNNATRAFAKAVRDSEGLAKSYAIIAANLFAASAAFDVLRKAADFSVMIKATEDLAAATGKSVSSIAASMKEITGQSIATEQAIRSASLAVSAGFDSSTISKLTEVATKASRALGRDMVDSLDRVIKGVVKAEPELLDELGIILRLDPAMAAYGASIGKTAKELTTFEKQQAVANAVIDQGLAKFAAVDLEGTANGYTKLAAAFNDMSKAGLGIVNNVLEPIANFFSEHFLALALAIAAALAKIGSMAFPVLAAKGISAADAMEKLNQKIRETRIETRKDLFGDLLQSTKEIVANSVKELGAATGKSKTITEQFAPIGAAIDKAITQGYLDSNSQKVLQQSLEDRINKAEKYVNNVQSRINTKQAELAKLPSLDSAYMFGSQVASALEAQYKSIETSITRGTDSLTKGKKAVDNLQISLETLKEVDIPTNRLDAFLQRITLIKDTFNSNVLTVVSGFVKGMVAMDAAAASNTSIFTQYSAALKDVTTNTIAATRGIKLLNTSMAVLGATAAFVGKAFLTAIPILGELIIGYQILSIALETAGEWLGTSTKATAELEKVLGDTSTTIVQATKATERYNEQNKVAATSVDNIIQRQETQKSIFATLAGETEKLSNSFKLFSDTAAGAEKAFLGMLDAIGFGELDAFKDRLEETFKALKQTGLDTSEVTALIDRFGGSIKDISDVSKLRQVSEAIDKLAKKGFRDAANAAEDFKAQLKEINDLGPEITKQLKTVFDPFDSNKDTRIGKLNDLAESVLGISKAIDKAAKSTKEYGKLAVVSNISFNLAEQLGIDSKSLQQVQDQLKALDAIRQQEAKFAEVKSTVTTGAGFDARDITFIDSKKVKEINSAVAEQIDLLIKQGAITGEAAEKAKTLSQQLKDTTTSSSQLASQASALIQGLLNISTAADQATNSARGFYSIISSLSNIMSSASNVDAITDVLLQVPKAANVALTELQTNQRKAIADTRALIGKTAKDIDRELSNGVNVDANTKAMAVLNAQVANLGKATLKAASDTEVLKNEVASVGRGKTIENLANALQESMPGILSGTAALDFASAKVDEAMKKGEKKGGVDKIAKATDKLKEATEAMRIATENNQDILDRVSEGAEMGTAMFAAMVESAKELARFQAKGVKDEALLMEYSQRKLELKQSEAKLATVDLLIASRESLDMEDEKLQVLEQIKGSSEAELLFAEEIGKIKAAGLELDEQMLKIAEQLLIIEEGRRYTMAAVDAERELNRSEKDLQLAKDRLLITEKEYFIRQRINELNLSGLTDDEAKKLRDKFAGIYDNRIAEEAATSAYDTFKGTVDDIVNAFQSGFENVFMNGKQGFRDFASDIKAMFAKMLAQLAVQAIARPIIMPIASAAGSLFGVSNEATSSLVNTATGGGGLLGSSGNLLSTGSNFLSSLTSGGGGLFGGLGSGISSLGSLFGSSFLNSIGATLSSGGLSGLIGSGITSLAGGGMSSGFLGGLGEGLMTAGFQGSGAALTSAMAGTGSGSIGAMIGSALPVIGSVLAVGSLIKSLGFSDWEKFSSGISVGVTDGQVTGRNFEKQKKKSFFKNKTRFKYSDLDPAIAEALQTGLNSNLTSLEQQAKYLNAGSFDRSTLDVNAGKIYFLSGQNKKALTAEEIQQRLTDWLTNVTAQAIGTYANSASLPPRVAHEVNRAGTQGAEKVIEVFNNMFKLIVSSKGMQATINQITNNSLQVLKDNLANIKESLRFVLDDFNTAVASQDVAKILPAYENARKAVVDSYTAELDAIKNLATQRDALVNDLGSFLGDLAQKLVDSGNSSFAAVPKNQLQKQLDYNAAQIKDALTDEDRIVLWQKRVELADQLFNNIDRFVKNEADVYQKQLDDVKKLKDTAKDNYEAQINALQKQLDLVEAWVDVLNNAEDLIRKLTVTSASPVSGITRLQRDSANTDKLVAQFNAATDTGKKTELATTIIDRLNEQIDTAGELYGRASSQYITEYNRVLGIINSIEQYARPRATEAEMLQTNIEALNKQMETVLDGYDKTIAELQAAIDSITNTENPQYKEAMAVAANIYQTSFTELSALQQKMLGSVDAQLQVLIGNNTIGQGMLNLQSKTVDVLNQIQSSITYYMNNLSGSLQLPGYAQAANTVANTPVATAPTPTAVTTPAYTPSSSLTLSEILGSKQGITNPADLAKYLQQNNTTNNNYIDIPITIGTTENGTDVKASIRDGIMQMIPTLKQALKYN